MYVLTRVEEHTVGNHTYHHFDMPQISHKEMFREELDDVSDLFMEITGAKLSLFYRQSQGKCNEENLKMAQERDVILFSGVLLMWNGIRMLSPAMKRHSRNLLDESSPEPLYCFKYFPDQWRDPGWASDQMRGDDIFAFKGQRNVADILEISCFFTLLIIH